MPGRGGRRRGARGIGEGTGTLMRVYDMIIRRHGIMHVGSCMIIWRDKAALSGHKLNRCPPLPSLPAAIHPPTPTIDIRRNAHARGGRTCCTFLPYRRTCLSSFPPYTVPLSFLLLLTLFQFCTCSSLLSLFISETSLASPTPPSTSVSPCLKYVRSNMR